MSNLLSSSPGQWLKESEAVWQVAGIVRVSNGGQLLTPLKTHKARKVPKLMAV